MAIGNYRQLLRRNRFYELMSTVQTRSKMTGVVFKVWPCCQIADELLLFNASNVCFSANTHWHNRRAAAWCSGPLLTISTVSFHSFSITFSHKMLFTITAAVRRIKHSLTFMYCNWPLEKVPVGNKCLDCGFFTSSPAIVNTLLEIVHRSQLGKKYCFAVSEKQMEIRAPRIVSIMKITCDYTLTAIKKENLYIYVGNHDSTFTTWIFGQMI